MFFGFVKSDSFKTVFQSEFFNSKFAHFFINNSNISKYGSVSYSILNKEYIAAVFHKLLLISKSAHDSISILGIILDLLKII